MGSSPCTLTTMSASVASTASARRSVPVACAAEVITASPPKPRTAAAMRSSSVATSTRSTRAHGGRARASAWIMGFPWMSERASPAVVWNRNRAGMMATLAKL